ncbi:MAG: GtrA family protein, partial [Treponema sp.]|nr:GtrA family protein [Treponema sp.]
MSKQNNTLKIETFRLFKFLLVGVVNTIVGNAAMFLFYNLLHFSYWISTATGYVLGGTVSYFLNKFFTFKNKDKSVRQLIFFIISLIVCYMVAFSIANIMGTLLLKNYSQTLRDNVAMLLGMGLYTALNYIAQRF